MTRQHGRVRYSPAAFSSGADPVTAVKAVCDASLERIRSGAPVLEILGELARAAEQVAGDGAASSILVINRSGVLRSAVAPQLPRDYTDAIDGLRPDAEVGTCAAAAATGEDVFTPNFMECGKWRELRHLPLALGYVGAWSRPIKSLLNDRVLGTFGTYYRDIRRPSAVEMAAVRDLAIVAACALENCAIDTELARTAEMAP